MTTNSAGSRQSCKEASFDLVGLIWLGVGLVVSFCVFGSCGSASILADIDHLANVIQECGFPPGILCLLAASGGRPWHSLYVYGSGFILIAALALCTGLLLGAVASRRVRVEDSVDGNEDE